ncbi:hypothetical protein [Nocardia veterana]|uniref:Uncharacterized protein n=1 Tax=Nocardia veterana TaxID=132249 RepID=A0A7X6LWV7_9NOCA|nr:hypothetical protein [Nocardia veterana]NKY85405.1 hypothetical protein [Nocardia veterana]
MPESDVRPRALTVGLHPKALDYSRFPDLDEAQLTARIDAANAALHDTEFEITPLLVGTSPTEAETEIRALLGNRRFDLVMIGGAIRAFPEHTELFEHIVNAVVETDPAIRLCFNTSPETTHDALRRGRARL